MKEIPGYILKPVIGFPGYYADTLGNIWSFKPLLPGRIPELHRLTAHPGSGRHSSYLKVVMVNQAGKSKNVEAHKAVCLAFHGPCPPGHQARHGNGNSLNNTPGNLSWGTAKENQRDRYRHGTDNRGSKCGKAKLSEEIARQIRAEYLSGKVRHLDLARRYQVGLTTVGNILRRETWTHV